MHEIKSYTIKKKEREIKTIQQYLRGLISKEKQ